MRTEPAGVKAGIPMLARLMMTAAWVFIAWRWGDWRHWQKYQATILYWIAVNLLEELLTYNYSLWEFAPTRLFPNHTAMSLTMLVHYTCIALVYLPRFPTGRLGRKIGWVGIWAATFVAIESAMLHFHFLSYHHGWNLLWSALLDIAMFSLVRLHQTRPGWAYLLTGVTTVAGLLVFRVPVSGLK